MFDTVMLDIWFWMWTVLTACFIVGELFTVSFFLLPFGLGAAVAALANFFGLTLLMQWSLFIAVSVVAFWLLRGFADKLTHEPPMKSGVDRLIGKTGIVIEDLTPDSAVGQIRIEREEWRADAPKEKVVAVGTHVIVDAVEGTHLLVHVAENPTA